MFVSFARGASAAVTVTPGNTYQYRLSGSSPDAGTVQWLSSTAEELHRVTVTMTRTGE